MLQGSDRLISQRKNKGKTAKEGRKNNLAAVIQSLIEQVDSIQLPWRMTIDPWAFFFIALAPQLSNIRIPFGSVSKFEGGCQEGIDGLEGGVLTLGVCCDPVSFPVMNRSGSQRQHVEVYILGRSL